MKEGFSKYGYKYSGSINDGNFFTIWATNRRFVKVLHEFISLVVAAPVFITVTLNVIFMVEIFYYIVGP